MEEGEDVKAGARRNSKKKRTAPTKGLAAGDIVRVTRSWSSDVAAGTLGTIVGKMESGYAVEITGTFTSTSRGNIWLRFAQTRCLYFGEGEIAAVETGVPADPETLDDEAQYPS